MLIPAARASAIAIRKNPGTLTEHLIHVYRVYFMPLGTYEGEAERDPMDRT